MGGVSIISGTYIICHMMTSVDGRIDDREEMPSVFGIVYKCNTDKIQ